jgi:hypothetical protein
MWSKDELKEHAANAVPVVKAAVKTAAPIILKDTARGAAASAAFGPEAIPAGARAGAMMGLKKAAIPAIVAGRTAYLQQGQADARY